MKQFDYNKYLKNNPLLKEGKKINEEMSELQILDVIKKVGEKLESLQSQFLQMKQKLKSGDQSVTADAVLDLGLKVLAEIEQIAP